VLSGIGIRDNVFLTGFVLATLAELLKFRIQIHLLVCSSNVLRTAIWDIGNPTILITFLSLGIRVCFGCTYIKAHVLVLDKYLCKGEGVYTDIYSKERNLKPKAKNSEMELTPVDL